MSNWINPALLPDFMDEQQSRSVQGCFQGSDMWEGEIAAEKALKRDRELRGFIATSKKEIEKLEVQLEKHTERHHTRIVKEIQEEIELLTNKIKLAEAKLYGK